MIMVVVGGVVDALFASLLLLLEPLVLELVVVVVVGFDGEEGELGDVVEEEEEEVGMSTPEMTKSSMATGFHLYKCYKQDGNENATKTKRAD
jgi:hypothetical protein